MFIGVILMAAMLNNWMYNNGIGLTGLTGGQAALPFRLGGILYYLVRFILPAGLFLIYMHTSRTWPLAALLGVYALWAGTSQVSRLVLIMLFFPLLFFSYMDRRYVRLGIAIVMLMITYTWVYNARKSVYAVQGGGVHWDSSLSLPELIWTTVSEYGVASPGDSVFAIIGRLGGAQDVVLASQYDTASMGGSLREFQRLYLFGSNTTGEDVAQALYGFVPLSGFSVGSGGFSCRILQIAGGNGFVLSALAAWISLLLTVGEVLVWRYTQIFRSRWIGYAVGGMHVIFLYAFSISRWLYAFIAVACFIMLCINHRILSMHPTASGMPLPRNSVIRRHPSMRGYR
jgi:hypothetical protein